MSGRRADLGFRTLPGRRWLAVVTLSMAMAGSGSAGAAQIKLGVVGDSLSDEYSEAGYRHGLNWVQQLVAYGVADVGPTAAAAGVGNWGEPRRSGFEYNWARAGATSQTLLAQGQHTGLAAQVGPRGITHVVLAVGANDFAPGGGYYDGLYHGTMNPEEIDVAIDRVVANIDTALQTLKATAAVVVMVNVPDYGVTPATRARYRDADDRERVAEVLRRLNRRLEELAAENGVPLVDLLGATKAVFGENASPKESIRLGNVALEALQTDDLQNSRPTAAFVPDGVHPHTTVQGILANLVVEAFNRGYGESTPLFSEQELLAHAGIPYGGRDTLMGELGVQGYDAFIVGVHGPSGDAVPLGRWLMLAAAGLLALVAGVWVARVVRSRVARRGMGRGGLG